MENTTNFIDETDYKKAWEWENRENSDLRNKLKEKTAEVEMLQNCLAETQKSVDELEEKLGFADRRICRLDGMIDAFKYCVRYYMAGGAE